MSTTTTSAVASPYSIASGKNVAYSKIGFVYNPMSFKGQGEIIFSQQIKPLVDKYIKAANPSVQITYLPTKKAGGAKENAEELIKAGCDLIVAAGGDGTIHEVVNGIMDTNTLKSKTALAIIPIGTGNDFAKTARLLEKTNDQWTPNYDRIVQVIAKGYTIQADVGHLDSTYIVNSKPEKRVKFFMNETSFGISGDVMETVNNQTSFWISKDFTFQFQSLWKQFTYTNRVIEYELDNNGKKIDKLNQVFAVSNGQFFGSGMQVNPQASITDGLLNICVLGDVGFFDMLSIIPALYKAEHGAHHKVSFEKCQTVTAKAKNPEEVVFIEADGELCGRLPCTVRSLAAVLPLVVPQV